MDEDCMHMWRLQEQRLPSPTEEIVERGRVRDYLFALEDNDSIDEDGSVPPLFILTLGRVRRPHASSKDGTAAVNGGDEFEFFKPVYIGDRITVTAKIASVEKKSGEVRQIFIVSSARTYHNQNGELVARRVSKTLRWMK